MHQYLATRIPLRVEIEPPLLRKRQLCPDVGDEELVGERMPGKADAQYPAHCAPGPIGGDHPGGTQAPAAGGHLDLHSVAILGQRDHSVFTAQVHQRTGLDSGAQVVLGTGLREVDPGRQRRRTRKPRGEQLMFAIEGAPHRPGDAFGEHRHRASDPVEHVKHITLQADRPRSREVPFRGRFHYRARHPPPGQQQCGDQPHRTGPDNHYRSHHARSTRRSFRGCRDGPAHARWPQKGP